MNITIKRITKLTDDFTNELSYDSFVKSEGYAVYLDKLNEKIVLSKELNLTLDMIYYFNNFEHKELYSNIKEDINLAIKTLVGKYNLL